MLLCVPDGGAAIGACASTEISASRTIVDGDGGVGTTFRVLPDGAIAGGWHDPGDPGGPPTRDWLPDAGPGATNDAWSPDAGPPTCAPGWNRVVDGTCDPALRSDCPAGAFAFPGGGCTATGESECGAGEYADPGPASMGATIVHVHAGANPALADGSAAQPFATLGASLSAAGHGGWVLVADGAYNESLDIGAAIHIVGHCTFRS